MVIDIILLILLLIAVVKGLRRGLMVALLSVIGLFVGLAAAIKLSAITATWLRDSLHSEAKWIPVLAFLLVFTTVILVIRWAALAMRSAGQAMLLGPVDRICGVILYLLLYISMYSVLLFYASRISLIPPDTVRQSVSYSMLQSWAPTLIDGMGKLIPWFKDMFHQLEDFFGHMASGVKN